VGNVLLKASEGIADMFLRHGVRRVDASAYLRITPAVVRYACSGLHTDPAGNIVRVNHLFAKLSRPEVAVQFLAPAPAEVVAALVQQGLLTAEEARLAQHIPLAEDITVEADSGGHTDNRPLVALFPTIRALRDQFAAKYGYTRPVRIGCGGGIGTPDAVAGAFALGAAFVLTGSINQAAVEAGTSDFTKQMLAQADIADVAMAPSPDMFEMGVRVQVLRKGTMFAGRASQLYDLYMKYDAIEQIPAEIRQKIEKDIFREPLDQIWQSTAKFFAERDPRQLEKANADSKYKMALVFRAYVGQSSHWAVRGEASRRLDYQIWCGPAMGSFNNWTRGSFLAEPANRTVVQMALNLLEGAAVVTRAQQLRTYGLQLPDTAFDYRPRPLQ
ncbi:MAG: PfaD family polyunsaturated fatty acid/polyketide biosynthesis protein, partial [Bryobacteraceae bacterium]